MNDRLTSLLSNVNQHSHSWDISVLKNRPWNSVNKAMCVVKGRGHIVGSATNWFTSFFVSHQSALASLWYSYFKISPWKSKARVMTKLKTDGNNMLYAPLAQSSVLCPTVIRSYIDLTSLDMFVYHEWRLLLQSFVPWQYSTTCNMSFHDQHQYGSTWLRFVFCLWQENTISCQIA